MRFASSVSELISKEQLWEAVRPLARAFLACGGGGTETMSQGWVNTNPLHIRMRTYRDCVKAITPGYHTLRIGDADPTEGATEKNWREGGDSQLAKKNCLYQYVTIVTCDPVPRFAVGHQRRHARERANRVLRFGYLHLRPSKAPLFPMQSRGGPRTRKPNG